MHRWIWFFNLYFEWNQLMFLFDIFFVEIQLFCFYNLKILIVIRDEAIVLYLINSNYFIVSLISVNGRNLNPRWKISSHHTLLLILSSIFNSSQNLIWKCLIYCQQYKFSTSFTSQQLNFQPVIKIFFLQKILCQLTNFYNLLVDNWIGS